ncbi:Protein pitchfork [Intoshia linei]|uniref:Protein pitchfork n=1 Tax=Intoshia linei TaxID=1819745 RepID=A0A177BBS4_9BILA|nr:Protein pitchfork [Intoshia linei]
MDIDFERYKFLKLDNVVFSLKQKKNIVAFGTSKLKRKTFPNDKPNNKFGIEMCPIRGQSNIAPGHYNNDQKTEFGYYIDNMVNSTKGYSMGARTTKRFFSSMKNDVTPAPGEYQNFHVKKQTALKPFNSGSQRFSKEIKSTCPGVGTYNVELSGHKEIKWPQRFLSKPLIPETTQRGIIICNNDKLPSTKLEKRYNRHLAYLKLYY